MQLITLQNRPLLLWELESNRTRGAIGLLMHFCHRRRHFCRCTYCVLSQ